MSGGGQIIGLDHWERLMATIPEVYKQNTNKVLDKSIKEFDAALRKAVPKKSGDLEATIEVSTPKELARKITIGTKKHPAGPVEFGHIDHNTGRTKGKKEGGVHVKAEPFFYPVKKENYKKHKRRLRNAARKAARAIISDGDD
jgi:hypothetical protein